MQILKFKIHHNTDRGPEATVEAYSGSEKIVRIPEKIRDIPVTRIGPHCFKGNKTITNVFLPHTVFLLDDEAFCNCLNLIQVTTVTTEDVPNQSVFGQNLIYIGRNCFANTGLLDIDVRSSFLEIGQSAFAETKDLIRFATSAETISIGESAFANSGIVLFLAHNSKPVEIRYRTFFGCVRLKGVYVPFTLVHRYAFWGCCSLQSFADSTWVRLADQSTSFLHCESLIPVAAEYGLRDVNDDSVFFDSTLLKLSANRSDIDEIEGIFRGAPDFGYEFFPIWPQTIGMGCKPDMNSKLLQPLLDDLAQYDTVVRLGGYCDEEGFFCVTSISCDDLLNQYQIDQAIRNLRRQERLLPVQFEYQPFDYFVDGMK